MGRVIIEVNVICPNCGTKNLFLPNQEATKCNHCGIVVSKDSIKRGLREEWF